MKEDAYPKNLSTYELLAEFNRLIKRRADELAKAEDLQEIEFTIFKSGDSTFCYLDVGFYNKQICIEEFLNIKIGGVKSFDFQFITQIITDMYLSHPNLKISLKFPKKKQ